MPVYEGIDRRKNARVQSKIPVQFRLLSIDRQRFFSDWLFGYTKDIGKGGICLTVDNLLAEYANLLRDRQALVAMELEMPMIRKPVSVCAKVVWMREASDEPKKFHVGLQYEELGKLRTDWLVLAALCKRYSPVFVLGVVGAFLFFLYLLLFK
ncbi:MAG: PilZ domain-containing protein [Candidatus Omnitrophica bacterium]|nr:PilZ domain-containing protein [Candidatus Omnitrophota bacterium]